MALPFENISKKSMGNFWIDWKGLLQFGAQRSQRSDESRFTSSLWASQYALLTELLSMMSWAARESVQNN